MHAGLVQTQLQWRIFILQHGEFHVAADGPGIDRAYVGLLVEAVGEDGLGDEGHNLAHVGVVQAQHGDAVERQALGEFDEGLLQLGEAVVVGLHVVGIDVGDDFDDRRQIEERGIRLVGLDHDEVARAKFGVGASLGQASANDEGGVEPAFGQHACHQAGGGGFAVCAGNRDAALQAHQFGQHHGARHDGDVLFAPGNDFGVV